MKEKGPNGSEFQAQPASDETEKEKTERLEEERKQAQAAQEEKRRQQQPEKKRGERRREERPTGQERAAKKPEDQRAAERAAQLPQSESVARETPGRTFEERQADYRAKREDLEARIKLLDDQIDDLKAQSPGANEAEIAKTEAEKASVNREWKETIERMGREQDERIRELSSFSAPERARYGVPEVAFDPNKLEEQMAWFQRTIARIESQKLPFTEAWQDTSALKWFISSIDLIKYPEHLGTLRTFQQIYENRRMLHDFMYVYEKAGGTDDIIGIAHYANLENLEQLIKGDVWVETEGGMVARDPVKAMLWFQGRADKVLEERKKVAEAAAKMEGASGSKKKEYKTEKDEAEERERSIISEMQVRARGEVVEIDKDAKKIVKPDDKEGAYYRLGGRLFSAFGFAAQYNITLNGSGDFLVGRLLNMKGHLLDDNWAGREKLWKYFRQESFARPLFSDKHLGDGFETSESEVGLETTEEIIDEKKGISARITRIVDDDKHGKFKNLSFRAHNVDGSAYASRWCDQNVKADKWRSYVLSGAGYSQSPDMQTFMEMSKYLEHIKGGKRRNKFTEGVMKGLIEFYKKEGLVFKKSDAQRLFGDKEAYWKSAQVEAALNTATPGMLSAEGREKLLKEYVGANEFTRGVRHLRDSLGRRPLLFFLGFLWDALWGALGEAAELKADKKKRR
ncbi:MAG TPA: hypothetical protein VMW04_03025 [Patescibacteria group bacterium]|nr:hypothetical protein [Patescibacteria group bacterium]